MYSLITTKILGLAKRVRQKINAENTSPNLLDSGFWILTGGVLLFFVAIFKLALNKKIRNFEYKLTPSTVKSMK